MRRADLGRLADLMERVRTCRACQDAGLLPEARPITAPVRDARVIVIGQAPGPVTHREGVHFAGPAGRTLAGWFAAAGFPEGADHKWAGLSAAWLSSLTRCFPGPSLSGTGDRAPSAGEIALCRPFLDEELEALDPDIIVLVGAMAIRAFLGPIKLDDAVGRRFEWKGRPVIPFPHSSGVSRWANLPANRAKVTQAIALLQEERERLIAHRHGQNAS